MVHKNKEVAAHCGYECVDILIYRTNGEPWCRQQYEWQWGAWSDGRLHVQVAVDWPASIQHVGLRR